MSEEAIAKAVEKIAYHETEATRHLSEVSRWKQFVNQHDELADRDPRYIDVGASTIVSAVGAAAPGSSAGKSWAAGEFLGKPFATVAKSILQARFDAVGKPNPASVDEIHASMVQGTYDFGAGNVDSQKQGIRIALGKNTVAFVKLPNTDLFGMIEWYPGLKREKRVSKNKDSLSGASGDETEEVAASPATPEAA